jgi:FemAB-related protein (PEP-CTERM system-associated)
MPFMNYGGPIAATATISRLLAERAVALAAELEADYLELRCTSALETTLPVSLRKVSLTVQLMADPEALYESFSRKHRKNIRSAQKNDLDVRVGGVDLLRDFFDVLQRSWRSLGTPLYSASYFERVLATFPNHTNVFICQRRGSPIGAAFTAHFNGTVEGMWAGARPEMRHLDGNYVLYWEMLRHACTAGHQRFHLGRSTSDSGAEQFKAKWNAEAQQLYWYFARPRGGAMPELNVDNPKYRLAIAAWRRLPLWATRVLGPRLARLIP